MPQVSRAAIFEILNTCKVPGSDRTLAGLKAVKRMQVDGTRVEVDLQLPEAFRDREQALREDLELRLRSHAGAEEVELSLAWERAPEAPTQNLLPTVKRCVVVGSGKGGVGKSTVAANLACAAAQLGLKVGRVAQHVHGGMGVDVTYHIHRFMFWCRALAAEVGSAEQHLQALGQWLADNDTLGWKYDLPEDR